jgi:hypothetical protein
MRRLSAQTRDARKKSLASGPGKQGCMYHIWSAQCQIQLGAVKCVDHHDFRRFFGCLAAPAGIQLALAVVACIVGVN